MLESNLDFSEICLKLFSKMDPFRLDDHVKWKRRKPQSCREFQAERNRHLICPKRTSDAACAGPTSRLGQKNPRPRRGVVWPPGAPPDAALWTINCPRGENPNPRRISQNMTPSSAAIQNSFGGQKVLFRHPTGIGIDPRSHLHRLHFDSMMVRE